MKENLMQVMQNAYRMDETLCLKDLMSQIILPTETVQAIEQRAAGLVKAVRDKRLKSSGLDAFLQLYDLSSEEGIALMCIAEALLRIPDKTTIDKLIKDKLSEKSWEKQLGKSHSWFVNAATWGLLLTGKLLEPTQKEYTSLFSALKGFVNRTTDPIIRTAVIQAMKILGQQFVMGETIESALIRARKKEAKGYLYSYDMLGEAAKTMEDAEIYFQAYEKAIKAVGEEAKGLGPLKSPGISIKLSALYPRYEWAKKEDVFKELLPKIRVLVKLSKAYNIGITIDAEEAERLELSLLLIEAMMADPLLEDYVGFGLAIQAYQKRASFVIDWLANLARTHKRQLMIRLVKGAYWDSEIKWAQEKGLKGYPVFTRKISTDISYLACAKKIIEASDVFYAQFATHNAHTVSSILAMVKPKQTFEFQCLHGMGDALYDNIVGEHNLNIPCRIYAPVGGHENLLGYLVRRLLENGANTSFVNRILDEKLPIEELVKHPLEKILAVKEIPNPRIPLPQNLFGRERPNSKGVDLTDTLETKPLLKEVETYFPTLFKDELPIVSEAQIDTALNKAHFAASTWDKISIEERAELLEAMARLLEKHKPELMALLIREGGKSIPDAISEIREAVDFCWYYGHRLREDFKVKVLPGPTGEYNQLSLHGRGIIACISPWNFPLAIFLGQILAALAAGNTVIAKPASQTPRIALKAVALLHEAGFPSDVVQVLIGSGALIGNRLVEDCRIQGVMFTGSTETARGINQKLAVRQGAIVPFIAETGGQNVMIVDSSALAEQVVSDVITSAFNSAGQRCSALRVLYLQEEVYDRLLKMLKGAMATLKIGDPAFLDTDIGPVIDQNAANTLQEHVKQLASEANLIYECSLPQTLPTVPRGAFFAPCAYEISGIETLKGEVFGPVLHVIRYKSQDLDKIIEAINHVGYGLTLGIHSRIDETVDYIQSRVRVGNTYVNRNMIGAVVGVQPFGGEGLSGTGPKAGGPHILPRLAIERTLSINMTAAGGNATLMSLME